MSNCFILFSYWLMSLIVFCTYARNVIVEIYCIPSKLNFKDNPKLLYYFHKLSSLCNISNTDNTKLKSSILSRILAEIDLEVNKFNTSPNSFRDKSS